MELTLNLISIIGFYALVAYLIFKNRKKIEFHKIYLLYKTKTGINLIDRIARFKFWKYVGYVGIPVGFIGMIGVFWLLLRKAPAIIMGTTAEKGVQLLLPWTGSGSAGPFMLIPFWTFIISIAVVILVHEGAHGIIARAHKIKLKSTGLGLLAVIPLAFVEPDEAQLEKTSIWQQLSVFAAGPFANICTAVIAFAVLIFLLAPAAANFLEPAGLDISGVVSGYPAEQAGIAEGDRILAVNGIDTMDSISFVSELEKITPGDRVTVLLQDREVALKTVASPENPEQAYLGISFRESLEPKSNSSVGQTSGRTLLFLITLFSWLILLNFGIGLINLLPLGPVDGGRMVKTVSKRFIANPVTARIIWFIISISALTLLIINLVGPIF